MPCFVGCIAIAFPRFALFLVWLLGGNYLTRAYDSWFWPLLGFFFLPTTTLAFAFGMNSIGAPGAMEPFSWLLVAIAFAIDIGLIGGGQKSAKRWQDDRRGTRELE